MASTNSDVTINKIDTEMTITVRLTRRFRFRIFMATKLMWLASRILGSEVTFNFEDEE